MPQSGRSPLTPHDPILSEIRRAFTKVERGGGFTLHETEVIDNYGSEALRRKARKMDTDRHWWEVRDDWIESFGGVGGLSFLDAEGFRYYLPAFMSYWLRIGSEPNSLAFHLEMFAMHDFDALFPSEEKAMIAKFLDYVRVTFRDRGAGKAIDKFWGRYLNVPNET